MSSIIPAGLRARSAIVGRSLSLVLMLASLAAIPAVAQQPADAPATYASPELAAFLADAARINAEVPDRLSAYRARIESEMSLSLLDSAGQERSAQLEQVASRVRWRFPDRYDQRVVGYRSQAVGPTFSLMSIFGGWTVPTLYGNSLQLGVIPATSMNVPRQPTSRRSISIHPLATNRDRYYTFAGGDTVAVLTTRDRRIPVVRVVVTPRQAIQGEAILFNGEMHLDADRRQIVRMRGRMVEFRGGRQTISAGSRIPGASGASFVELLNAEFAGEFWLPVYQRTEIQARIALLGDFRAIVRIVSRFSDYELNDSTWFPGVIAPPGVAHHLTFAPSAEQSAFSDWRQPIGASTAEVAFDDFDDLSPDSWRTVGDATFRFRPRSLGDVFRFNRVEGVYTGLAGELDLRERVPGLVARGSVGWAWSERTMRGMIGVEQRRGDWSYGLRLERALANTNDFQPPLSWGSTLSALIGSTDDFDYLDRRTATIHLNRWFGSRGRSSLRFEAGPAADREVFRNVERGLTVEGEGFRPNRRIAPGEYLRSALTLDVNPQVSGLFVNRGLGARIHYERADGGLDWQRAELRVAARRELGPLEIYARGDVGTLIGNPVPQVLFELGRREGLSSYGYKEFVGDRAALARALIGYTLPVLRAPMILPGRLVVPGLAPGVAVGVHGGWTQLSSDAARQAALALVQQPDGEGIDPEIVPRETDGIRASGEILATLFSGALSIGITRPLDGSGGWRFLARIGQGF